MTHALYDTLSLRRFEEAISLRDEIARLEAALGATTPTTVAAWRASVTAGARSMRVDEMAARDTCVLFFACPPSR